MTENDRLLQMNTNAVEYRVLKDRQMEQSKRTQGHRILRRCRQIVLMDLESYGIVSTYLWAMDLYKLVLIWSKN